MNTNRYTKILEAILFASGSTVLEDDLKDKMINKKDFKQEMDNLKEFYNDRGINLIKTGNKWSFRTAESIKDELTILHCNTDYPTSMADVNLKAMSSMAKFFGLNVGYSDHTLGFETAISSIAMGAKVIEKHITLSKKMRGPDHPASMEPKEFYEFVKSIRNTEKLLGNNIKKPTKKELGIRKIIRKSIVAKFKINKGEKFSESNIISKRPEGGISSLYWNRVIGKKAKINFKRDDFIKL